MSYTPDQLHNAIEAGFAHGDSELPALVRLARRLARLSPRGPDADATRRMRLRFEAVMAGETHRAAAWWWPFGAGDWRRPSLAQRFAAGALLLTALGGTASAVSGVSPAEAARATVRVFAGAVQNLGPHTFLEEIAPADAPTAPSGAITPSLPAAQQPGAPSTADQQPPASPEANSGALPAAPPSAAGAAGATPSATATPTAGGSPTSSPTVAGAFVAPPPGPSATVPSPTATPRNATPTKPPAMNQPQTTPTSPPPTATPSPSPTPGPSASATPTATPSPSPTPHEDDGEPEDGVEGRDDPPGVDD